MFTLIARLAAGRRDSPRLSKVMRSKRRRLLAEALEDRRMLAVVHWISDSDGDWNDAANWQDQTTLVSRVPGFGDDVVIDRGVADPVITVTGTQQSTP